MTRIGKIARLPNSIREELNQRLLDGHTAKTILPWLNDLPEVRSILDAQFDGKPINPVNLSQWRNGGYQDWLVRQQALKVVQDLAEDTTLSNSESFTAKLSQWLAMHLAATAQVVVAAERDPNIKWARLRELSSALSRIRHGESQTERLRLDREWLALEQTKTEAEREKLFWEWTRREDIHEKLYPNQEKGLSMETIRKIERELKLM